MSRGDDLETQVRQAFANLNPVGLRPLVDLVVRIAAGVLFGFSDAFDMLMIINPATGAAVPYPGSFTTIDCEGLVFVTTGNDPLYGVLRSFD
ncbi:MAG: hypothetical protein IH888_11270 [Planctomycetes bacterium]|nr:hypothetical protein [Planctomycetota bacterium]